MPSSFILVTFRKISSKIKKVFSFVDSRFELHNEMKANISNKREYLVPGNYKLKYLAHKKIAYIKNRNTMSFITDFNTQMTKSNMNLKSKIASNIKECLNYFLIKNVKLTSITTSPVFEGELIMVTREDDMKIFDFKNKKVLTLLKKEDFYNRKKIYFQFQKHFKMPKVQFLDSHNAISEILVDFKPYPQWAPREIDLFFTEVFNNYKNYSLNFSIETLNKTTTENVLLTLKNSVENKELLKFVNLLIPQESYNDYWPLAQGHGDLTFNNVLLSDQNYYFIDWEDSAEFLFFYDIFNLFFVDFLYKNELTYIKSYLQGTFDKELSKLFTIYGKDFNKNYKLYYLGLFICERISTFEPKKNPKKTYKKYPLYIKAIQKIIYEIEPNKEG